MRRPHLAAVLLSASILVGCHSSSGITGVSVVAPAQVTGGLRFQLQATVEGTGADKTVRWSVEGGGRLVDAAANPAFYIAPMVSTATTVHLKATAGGDSSKSGSADVQVVPAVPFVATIDPSLVPVQSSLPGPQGTPIQIGASRDAAGVVSEIVIGQVRVGPKTDADLTAFLQQYQGTVIGDDSVPEPPVSLGLALTAAQRHARSYLVSVNLAAFDTSTFATDAAAVGLGGTVAFSSDETLRTVATAMSAAAAGFSSAPDALGRPQGFPAVMLSTQERPIAGGGFVDAFTATPDWSRFWASGSQSNVTLAWQFLSAHGFTRRVLVAIIDGGFWLDTAGHPRGNDTDLPANPIQYNFNGDTAIADGPNPNNCSGGSSCFWHGNNSAGVAIGLISNSSGAAGVGGQVGDPMLFKFNGTHFQRDRAIRTAAAWGADVVSMSFGGDCNKPCRIFDRTFTPIDDAVNAGSKAVFVAAAGNGDSDGNGYDVSDPHFVHPCLDDHVLCVGALNDDVATRIGYSNFGGPVRLFAPTDIPTMSSPAPNDSDAAGPAAPRKHSGTSAATPFVAGVAAMVKSLAPDMAGDDVAKLLTDTAHLGASPVDRYVDAYAAVVKAAQGIDGVSDGLEPNDSEGTARGLTPGTYTNLNLSTDHDQDYYLVAFAKPTNVTIDLSFMGSLGTVSLGDGYGLASQTGGCGRFEQVTWRPSKNALSTVYAVPAGTYFMKLSGRINAYDLSWSAEDAFIFPVNPDSYEPNDSFGSATGLGGGASGSATITAGDADFYRFDSPGSISGRFLSTSAGFGIRNTDVPLTATLYDAHGVQVGAPVSNDATCGSNPRFGKLPVGVFYVKVEASVPGATGNYDFGAGVSAQGGDGPIHDRVYQVEHPGDPIEGRFSDRYDGYLFVHSPLYSEVDLTAQEALQISLLDPAGNVLASADSTFTGQYFSAKLLLTGAVPGSQYLLEVNRTTGITAAPPPNVPSVGYTLSWSGPTPTDSLNLIRNGDADDGNQGATSTGDVVPIVGWQSPDGSTLTVVNYSVAGPFPSATDPGPADRLAHFFAGGPGSAVSSADQVIDLASVIGIEQWAGWQTAIDQSRAVYKLSGYLGGFGGDDDAMTLTATFLDAVQAPLGTMAIGPVFSAERDGVTGLFLRKTDGNMPPGTRQVQLHLESTRTSGSYNDGYADSLSFSIQAVGM